MNWYMHDSRAMLMQAMERIRFPKYPEDRMLWSEVARRCASELESGPEIYSYRFEGDALILEPRKLGRFNNQTVGKIIEGYATL